MKKVVRIYPKEPEKKFDVEKLSSELYSQLESFFSSEKERRNYYLNYEIEVEIKFPRDGWKHIDKIREELYQILRPYWSSRKKPGKEVIPLHVGPEKRDEEFWYLSISWRSSCKGGFNTCKNKIFAEVLAIMLPEDMRWNIDNRFKLTLEEQNMRKTLVYSSSIPETSKFSFFDMSVDKEKVKKYYDQKIVNEVIKKFTEGRFVRIKYAKGSEQPKMRMWKIYKKELLSAENPSSLVEKYNMMQIYTSIDKIDVNHPDIFVIETDVGDMLKIVDPERGYKLSFEVVSRISNFLKENEIKHFVHLSGHRSFHLWAGSSLEKPTQSYQEVLANMGIEDENLNSVYSCLKLLGKAIGVYVVRKMPESLRKKYSINRENASERYYKVLVDVLSSKKCAVGCPLSLNAKTGLAYTRVPPSWSIQNLKKREIYLSLCRPTTASSLAQLYPEIYSEIAPRNEVESFEQLSDKLKREMVLVLYTKVNPNLWPDYALIASENKVEKIYREYFN